MHVDMLLGRQFKVGAGHLDIYTVYHMLRSVCVLQDNWPC